MIKKVTTVRAVIVAILIKIRILMIVKIKYKFYEQNYILLIQVPKK